MEKVSVIITTYKGSDNIENSILSVLNQTYKAIEIIVVDDNGKNSFEQITTEKKIKKYIDNKLITYVVHDINKNGSTARNTGVKFSTGKWISFLDDDDLYLEEKIEKELNYAMKMNADMIVCGGYFIHQNGYGYKSVFKKNSNLLLDYLTEKSLFNSSSIFIKKDKFEFLDGFDESFRRHQDWEFCTRAIIGLKLYVLNEILYLKYSFGRNVATNPSIAEENINHFFEVMGDEILNFDSKAYRKIYNYHMLKIARLYFLKRDKKNFLRIMKKSSYRLYYFRVFQNFLFHTFKKIMLGSSRRYLSYADSVKKLKEFRGDFFEQRRK